MIRQSLTNRRNAVLAAALLAGGLACSLSKQEIPALSGPAEQGIAFQLSAAPDVLTADGHSTSAIQVRVFNQNGQPLSGQGIFFAVTNIGGAFVDIGTLSSSTAVSNGSGVAQVIYTSPPRTDSTSTRMIQIAARPMSGDAQGNTYRAVRIELRSAEPRLFPGGEGCEFVVEPGTLVQELGKDVLFQSVAPLDTVRYEWDFGDGTTGDHPQEVHRYGFTGVYTVTHVVTASSGAALSCAKDITIIP